MNKLRHVECPAQSIQEKEWKCQRLVLRVEVAVYGILSHKQEPPHFPSSTTEISQITV